MSIREMLEKHRANPVCASCHARMDPLGFSLENFDAIGQWRTTDAGKTINASGVLLDGTKVKWTGGPATRPGGVETAVRNSRNRKLLTYMLGHDPNFMTSLPCVRSCKARLPTTTVGRR